MSEIIFDFPDVQKHFNVLAVAESVINSIQETLAGRARNTSCPRDKYFIDKT